MATVNFLYRSTKENATLSLRLLYRFNNKDFVFSSNTKIEVSKLYWNKQHKSKRPNVDLSNKQNEINNKLNSISNFIIDSFNSTNTEIIDKNWLVRQMDLYYNPPKITNSLPNELLQYVDYYKEHKKNSITAGSMRALNVVKARIERYQSLIIRPIKIEDINAEFKLNFERYCINQNYATNTIAKTFQVIKTICIHAKDNGLATHFQLEKIHYSRKKIDNIYLSFDELEKIETATYNESLENIKDWLVISCYSGQRISDFMRFDKSMIRHEKNNKGDLKALLEFTQVKTGKLMTIPIHEKVLKILEKNDGDFPRKISDQRYNEYIKDVCKIAKINSVIKGSKSIETEPKSGIFRKKEGLYEKYELVTSHIGRRSFASNFYGIIGTTFLMYVTGHSTEGMFLNYIGKSNKDLAIQMTEFF